MKSPHDLETLRGSPKPLIKPQEKPNILNQLTFVINYKDLWDKLTL